MAAADAEAAELADAAASMSAETADCAEKKKAEAKIDEANQKAKDAKDRAEKMKSDMEEELNLTHFRLSSQVSFQGDCLQGSRNLTNLTCTCTVIHHPRLALFSRLLP